MYSRVNHYCIIHATDNQGCSELPKVARRHTTYVDGKMLIITKSISQ